MGGVEGDVSDFDDLYDDAMTWYRKATDTVIAVELGLQMSHCHCFETYSFSERRRSTEIGATTLPSYHEERYPATVSTIASVI